MQLASILAHIKNLCPALRQVGGAAEFSALPEAGPQAVPAAFVVPLEERAGHNALDTGISQRVDTRFGVILAVRNLRDGVGAAANDDLETLRRAVKDALLGWQPAGADDVCTFGGGRVLQLANQVLWWQDDFLTAYYERKV